MLNVRTKWHAFGLEAVRTCIYSSSGIYISDWSLEFYLFIVIYMYTTLICLNWGSDFWNISDAESHTLLCTGNIGAAGCLPLRFKSHSKILDIMYGYGRHPVWHCSQCVTFPSIIAESWELGSHRMLGCLDGQDRSQSDAKHFSF